MGGTISTSHCGGYQTLFSGLAANGLPLMISGRHSGQAPFSRTESRRKTALGQWLVTASEKSERGGNGRLSGPRPAPNKKAASPNAKAAIQARTAPLVGAGQDVEGDITVNHFLCDAARGDLLETLAGVGI